MDAERVAEPIHLRRPFSLALDPAATSVNYSIKDLLAQDELVEDSARAADQLLPEPDPDLGQGRADRSFERADVGMLRRDVDLDRNRTLHREPLQMLACLTTPAYG